MEKKFYIKTTKREIIEYYLNNIPINEIDLNFDWSEADQVCWNCGDYSNTERCHIIPNSLDGDDIPKNYVLLCNECHIDAPNTNNSNIIWVFLFFFLLNLPPNIFK